MIKRLTLLIFSVISLMSIAQPLFRSEPNLYPDDKVNSYYEDTLSNILYLGGHFDYVGPLFKNGAVIPNSTLKPNTSFGYPNNPVLDAINDESGNWIIGGMFDKIGETEIKAIAKLSVNGELLSWGLNLDNGTDPPIVNKILRKGDSLFIGGGFTSIDGYSTNNFAVVLLSTSEVLMTGPALDGEVTDFVVNDNEIYLIGGFTNGIKLIDRVTGLETLINCIIDGNPESIVHDNGNLYIGGFINSVNSSYAPHLFKYNISLDQIDNLSITSMDGGVNKINMYGDSLVITGSFSEINGEVRKYVAAISKSSGFLHPLSFNFSCDLMTDIFPWVTTSTIYNDTLYIGGGFSGINGIEHYGLTAIDLLTQTIIDDWSLFISNADDLPRNVNVISKNENGFYIGGYFNSIGGSKRRNICAINLNTEELLDFNPFTSTSINNYNLILDIEKFEDSLICSGYLDTVNGNAFDNILKMNAINGTINNDWKPNFNNAVRDISIHDGIVYCTGPFDSLNNERKYNVAAIDLISSNDIGWSPIIYGQIFESKFFNNQFYIGGNFQQIDGITRYNIASFDVSSFPTLSTFQIPSLLGNVNGFEFKEDEIYVTGQLTTGGVARINAYSGDIIEWSLGNDITSVSDGVPFYNSFFMNGMVGSTMFSQATYEITSTSISETPLSIGLILTDFNTGRMEVFNNKIYILGQANNFIDKYSYSIFDLNDLVLKVSELEINNSLSIYPNPSKGEFTVGIPNEFSFSNDDLIIYSSNGTLVYRKSINAASKIEKINLSSFDSGIYFIQIGEYSGKYVLLK